MKWNSTICRTGALLAAFGIVASGPVQAQDAKAPKGARVQLANERYSEAVSLSRQGRDAAAVKALQSVLAADAEHIPALAEMTWLLTMSSDADIRDPKEAVRLGTRAVDLVHYKGRQTRADWTKEYRLTNLYNLTLAYAAAGDYRQAITHAQLVLEVASHLDRKSPSTSSAELLTAAKSLYDVVVTSQPTLSAKTMSEMDAACAANAQEANALADPPARLNELARLNVPMAIQ